MSIEHDIADFITDFIAERTGVPAHEIEPEENLGSYGLGSMQAVDLVGSLEDRYRVSLSPALVFQYPTVRELSIAVAQRAAEPAGA
ncbi:acyl carrier protein [Methyloversatilis discipulorum]|uniref:acyl carrier protein n=1 Tax=Methyloversatilis discipulorum TaxID=1119528 RepID=UPI001A380026|nr:acyl carrier protein [Methyloversatilis discipulorum]MBL8467089.1 acyl carrier protein [Methyloversatilis discipulorum]